MIAHARVELTCPRCDTGFLESARLIRAGGTAWCPHCDESFPLDDSSEAGRRVLNEARSARLRRRARISERRQRWTDPAPAPAAVQPRRLTDVIAMLDAVIARFEDSSRT